MSMAMGVTVREDLSFYHHIAVGVTISTSSWPHFEIHTVRDTHRLLDLQRTVLGNWHAVFVQAAKLVLALFEARLLLHEASSLCSGILVLASEVNNLLV